MWAYWRMVDLDEPGFALFRRNRVVIGGDDFNYKPEEIFGQAQSTIAHKLFGEIDLEDFPINQAKDGFVWDDGLEELFIRELKLHIKEYIDIAKITNKKRTEEEETSKEVSDKVETQVKGVLERSFGNQDDQLQLFGQEEFSELNQYREYQEEQNNLPETVDDKIRSYKIELNPASKCTLSVQWTLGNASTWIKVDSEEDGSAANIQLNINHPFLSLFLKKRTLNWC